MGDRRFGFAPGEYYHLYNRGNSKQKIFLDHFDYERFLTLLFIANGTNPFKLFFLNDVENFDRGTSLVHIGAHCLMPNHFHVLLTPAVEGGVATFMKKVTTGYSMYFNNKYKRTGSLFEGRYKAQLAENDNHLKYLFSYIHLNPLKLFDPNWKTDGVKDENAAKRFAESYRYSSLSEYVNDEIKRKSCLSKDSFPQYHRSPEEVRKDLFVWLSAT